MIIRTPSSTREWRIIILPLLQPFIIKTTRIFLKKIARIRIPPEIFGVKSRSRRRRQYRKLNSPHKPASIAGIFSLERCDRPKIEKAKRLRQDVDCVQPVPVIVRVVIVDRIRELIGVTWIPQQTHVLHFRTAAADSFQRQVYVDQLITN